MNQSHFEEFFLQALGEEPAREAGLSLDDLYGVYTSWCLLSREDVRAPELLWEALRDHGVTPENNHLVMKGPAAADYIIASAPNLV